MIYQNINTPSLYKTNFMGQRLPHQTFAEFEKFAKNTEFMENLGKIITPENLIGEGRCNRVYSIPQSDVFLLRVQKTANPNDVYKNVNIREARDVFPNNNLGQKVAYIGENIEIIIKQDGVQNSLKGREELLKQNSLPPNVIPVFIEKLHKISEFNQQTFNNLARETGLINSKNYVFDFYNPHNMMIDDKNKSLNIVDVEPANFRYRNLLRQNNRASIIFSLIDPAIFLKAYKESTIEQKRQLCIFAKTIMNKVKASPLNKDSVLSFLVQKLADVKNKQTLYREYKELKQTTS